MSLQSVQETNARSESAYHLKEHSVAVKLVGGTALLAPPLGPGAHWRSLCWLCVESKLSANGAGGLSNGQRHLTYAEILLDQTGQRHTVLGQELLMPSGRAALHLLTLLGGRCCTSLLNPITYKKYRSQQRELLKRQSNYAFFFSAHTTRATRFDLKTESIA